MELAQLINFWDMIDMEECTQLPRRRHKKRKAADNGEYTYEELLARAMALVCDRHHRMARREWLGNNRDDEKPLLMRVGGRKTLWVNFTGMCSLIQRSLNHVREFYVRELGTAAWLDDKGRLLLRGKYVPKYVAQLWCKYVQEYVACRCCGSTDSILSRDSISHRQYIVNCQYCRASFSAGSSVHLAYSSI